MPKINLESDTPSEMFGPHVVSRMLFHDEPFTAYTFFAKAWLNSDPALQNAAPEEVVNLPAQMIKALVVGPGLEELEKQKAIRLREGYTAGCVLLSLRIFAEFGAPLTMARAIRVLERAKAADNSMVQGVQLYCDKPKILESWNRMAPVAHLYAANTVILAKIENQELPHEAGTIDNLLGLAASFLAWATTTKFDARSSSQPLINAEAAWSLPDRYKPFDLGAVDKSKMPTWLINAIDLYTSQS